MPVTAVTSDSSAVSAGQMPSAAKPFRSCRHSETVVALSGPAAGFHFRGSVPHG